MTTTFGKTIRLFLVDGTVNSLMTVELSNWTGIGIKVPRIKIKEYNQRPELQKPGVYILLGKNEYNEDAAYIGEAEVIFERLQHHIANKEFWNEAIVFGSKDKYLNKASVKYLESRLYEIATTTNRYKINQNQPTKPELSEAEQAELEEFLSNIKTLTATLGHRIFESVTETIDIPKTDEHFFFCRNNNGALAKGVPSTEGFIVFKDSLMVATTHQSLTQSILNERQQLLNEGTLVKDGSLLKLTRDYIFNSSSRAAAAIVGRSARGPAEWKTESGISLSQYENSSQ